MDLEGLFDAVDALPPEEFQRLYDHIQQKRSQLIAWWIVPPDRLTEIEEIMRPVREAAAKMSEDEINAAIDEAIGEVRGERRTKNSD